MLNLWELCAGEAAEPETDRTSTDPSICHWILLTLWELAEAHLIATGHFHGSQPPCAAVFLLSYCAGISFLITSSMLKLAGLWRGGNSLNVSSHCATAA
jgi:hypothetical protein